MTLPEKAIHINKVIEIFPGTLEQPHLYVAPMMAWTDKHCRYLHRQFAPTAVLFTEMVSASALVQGDRWQLLDHNPQEHPLVLQLGGSDPDELARCARVAQQRGFAEINLNVGCPSERVQRGTFGACLMRQPQQVARCVEAMANTTHLPVSVKCRLGVDDHDSDELLDQFVTTVAQGGCDKFYVHARKAILGGLTPAQNRSIPPLQHDRVQSLKTRHPHLVIVANGGIRTTDQAVDLLRGADGVMIGRAAYQNPRLLTELEHACRPGITTNHKASGARSQHALLDALSRYRTYIEQRVADGESLHSMTRHMLTLCNGLRGAKRYRQTLSDQQRLRRNEVSLLDDALAMVDLGVAA